MIHHQINQKYLIFKKNDVNRKKMRKIFYILFLHTNIYIDQASRYAQ